MDNRRSLIALAAIIIGVLGVAYYYTSSRGLDINGAEDVSNEYLGNINDPDIAIDEIMEFQYNYYVIYYEKSTGAGAFEMLIDKQSGQIFPEYGPNMMWNLKYGSGGMMGGGSMMGGGGPQVPANSVMDESTVMGIAQDFLDATYPGSVAEDPHPFYGYYTIHTTRNGEVSGMLSVNQYTGSVWYHNWHGKFIQSVEIK
ncbi:hypothetical protein E4H04_08805 [Candidatus Bathyarchaeota archaeon]|nr:MAG: hypothetical protein E4H04_08805 [Candidatus Bathyarchaeota archaeon]